MEVPTRKQGKPLPAELQNFGTLSTHSIEEMRKNIRRKYVCKTAKYLAHDLSVRIGYLILSPQVPVIPKALLPNLSTLVASDKIISMV